MVCIYCNGNLAVTNSRPQKSRNQVWRRRLCTACGAVFTAIESIDLAQSLTVATEPLNSPRPANGGKLAAKGGPTTVSDIKPTGRTGSRRDSLRARPLQQLQPFDRDRLFISIFKSLQHRPEAASDARALAATVIAHIIPQAEHGLITRRTIAAAALNTLRRFDAAAATHYAAFHEL